MADLLKPNWAIDLTKVEYDLSICALGYETRSRYAAGIYEEQCNTANKIALSFDLNRCLAYTDNKAVINRLGYEIIQSADEELGQALKGKFEEYFSDDNPKDILVDISSFSRYRLAKILEALYQLAPNESQIYFSYSVANFENPKPSSAPITRLSPLTSFFAGMPFSPNHNLSCLMGVGYEEDRAIGALEFLEIGEAIIFKPISLDNRYDLAVDEANKILLGDIPSEKIIRYEMAAPARIYSIIDSTVKGLKAENRIVAIPLGPKIFALISLLVSINHYPEMPIWSVSSIKDDPVDKTPSGEMLSFSVVKTKL